MKNPESLFESAISRLCLSNIDTKTINKIHQACFEAHSFSDYSDDDMANPESDEYGTVLPSSDEQNELKLGEESQPNEQKVNDPDDSERYSSETIGKELIDSYIEYGKPVSLSHYIEKLIIGISSFSAKYSADVNPEELSVESNKGKIKKILKDIQEKSADVVSSVTSPKSPKILQAKNAIDAVFNSEFSAKSEYDNVSDTEDSQENTLDELQKIANERGTVDAFNKYVNAKPSDTSGYTNGSSEDELSPFEDKSRVESVFISFLHLISKSFKSGTSSEKPNLFSGLSSEKEYMNNIKRRSLDRIHAKRTISDDKAKNDADLFSL